MLPVKLLSGFSLCPVFKDKFKIFGTTGTFEEKNTWRMYGVLAKKNPNKFRDMFWSFITNFSIRQNLLKCA